MSYENTTKVKIRLVCDSGVGKSNFLLRFTDQTFTESFLSTIGVDFKIKTEQVDGDLVNFEVWDSSSQERFSDRGFNGKDFHGFIVFYDTTDFKAVENINNLLERYGVSDQQPVLIVGTKSDLIHNRKVEIADVQKIATTIPNCVGVIEVSSKDGKNVTEAFHQIAKPIVKRLREEREFQIEKINSTISKDQKKYMSELEVIWNKNSNIERKNEQKIIDLLNDYTQNDNGLMRFFTGHWNRHHVDEINAIVKNAGGKSSQQLLDEIKCIKLVNPQGSLAAIIHLVEEKLNLPLDKRFLPNIGGESSSLMLRK